MKKVTQARWRKSAVILLAATMAAPLAIVACGGTTDTTTPTPTTEQGGTLRVGFPASVTAINPWALYGNQATAYNFATFLNRYATLMKLSDVKFQWIPSLAADYPTELEREGDSWVTTVTLRDNAIWSDSEKLDANDVVFTLNTVLAEGISGGNWSTIVNRRFFERAERIDDLTVKIYFKALDAEGNEQTPGLPIWQFGTALTPVLAEHFWQPHIDELSPCTDGDSACQQDRIKSLEEIDATEEPIAGPATFLEWQEGAFIGVEDNPDSFIFNSSVTQYQDGTVEETVLGETNRWLSGTEDGSASAEDLSFGRPIDPDRTIFNFYSSNDAAILALQAGEIDYFLSPLGLPSGLLNRVLLDDGLNVDTNPSNGFRYLAFNFDREPFNDLAFREAVAWLIDRDFLADSILQGVVQPIFTPVPVGNEFWHNPDTPRIGGTLNITEDNPEFQDPILDADGNPTFDDDGTPRTRTKAAREVRIERVVEILTDAGYTWDTPPSWDIVNRRVIAGEGLRKPDGTPITQRERLLPDGTTETINTPFELLTTSNGYDPLRATAGLVIANWLSDAGIPTNANLTGFNEIVQKVFSGGTTDGQATRNFDMWILGWGLGAFPVFLENFFSQANAGIGGNNAGNFNSERYEELLRQFEQEADTDESQQIVYELQVILAEELPYIYLFSVPIRDVYNPEQVQFPYVEVLDGVQNLFQGFDGSLANANVTN